MAIVKTVKRSIAVLVVLLVGLGQGCTASTPVQRCLEGQAVFQADPCGECDTRADRGVIEDYIYCDCRAYNAWVAEEFGE